MHAGIIAITELAGEGLTSSLCFFKEGQAITYAQQRAYFRSGEIRIFDSTGTVERPETKSRHAVKHDGSLFRLN
jgi:hypothetical protein